MTREADEAPASKSDDMRERCALIEDAEPDFAVSIHQNSYTLESVCGPQVFYYATSAEGEALAGILQDTINTKLEIRRPRTIKANDTYYLLKRSASPTVIVECGFLSNQSEAMKLKEEEYQKKVASAICDGILLYFEKR